MLSKVGFPDEDTLHTLVEKTPQLLPLAGSPQLAVVGREVRLGSGSADLIAVEPSGRLVIIEVKLAKNAEARRAVVAQVLAYAAHLQGLSPTELEGDVLRRHLQVRGFDTLFAAALSASQEDDSDSARARFEDGLSDSLRSGSFRLVIVLDDVPDDLVTLVGYLQYVTDRLLIDLVTLASYQVGGTQLVVPTRVEPERARPARSEADRVEGTDTAGIDEFRQAVALAPVGQLPFLTAVCDWAEGLADRGLAALTTYKGSAGPSLRVYVPGDMSLVTIGSGATAWMQLWQSVFDRRAPVAKVAVESVLGASIKQGTGVRDLPEGLLSALTSAYVEASGGKLET